MELRSSNQLTGGIAEVVMHPTPSTLPDELLTKTDDSLSLSLHHEGSTYSEVRSCTNGMYSVRHQLTVVGYLGEGLDSEAAVQQLLKGGVIADVRLNSGAVIRVGWSVKYGSAAPLRLITSETATGEKRLDYPLKRWVLESTDTSSLI
ncbi:MAG: hypothetical protein SNG14_07600 [Rikenellaceae bacterium]